MNTKVTPNILQLAACACMQCGSLFDSKAELHHHRATKHSASNREAQDTQCNDVRELTDETNHKKRKKKKQKKQAVQTNFKEKAERINHQDKAVQTIQEGTDVQKIHKRHEERAVQTSQEQLSSITNHEERDTIPQEVHSDQDEIIDVISCEEESVQTNQEVLTDVTNHENHQATQGEVSRVTNHKMETFRKNHQDKTVRENLKERAVQKIYKERAVLESQEEERERNQDVLIDVTNHEEPETDDNMALTKPCFVLLDPKKVSNYLGVQMRQDGGEISCHAKRQINSRETTRKEDQSDKISGRTVEGRITRSRKVDKITSLMKPCRVLLDPLEVQRYFRYTKLDSASVDSPNTSTSKPKGPSSSIETRQSSKEARINQQSTKEFSDDDIFETPLHTSRKRKSTSSLSARNKKIRSVTSRKPKSTSTFHTGESSDDMLTATSRRSRKIKSTSPASSMSPFSASKSSNDDKFETTLERSRKPKSVSSLSDEPKDKEILTATSSKSHKRKPTSSEIESSDDDIFETTLMTSLKHKSKTPLSIREPKDKENLVSTSSRSYKRKSTSTASKSSNDDILTVKTQRTVSPVAAIESSDVEISDIKLETGRKPKPASPSSVGSSSILKATFHSSVIPLTEKESIDENISVTELETRRKSKPTSPASVESSSDNGILTSQKNHELKPICLSPLTISEHSSKSSKNSDSSAFKKSCKCNKCDQKFLKSNLLKRHECIKKDLTKFICQICNKNYDCQNDLNSHKFKIHASWFKIDLKNEKSKINTRKEFKCDCCKSYFRTKSLKRNHILTCQSIKIHNKKCIDDNELRPFKCTTCDKRFPTNVGLKVHMSVEHFPIKNYFCLLCDEKFFRKRELQTHVDVVHRNRKKVYPCKNCKKKFSSKWYLEEHVLSAHMNESEISTVYFNTNNSTNKLIIFSDSCHICGKIFKSIEDLKEHISKIHIEKMKHKCELCNEEYDSLWYLKLHKKTIHKNEESLNIKHNPKKYECFKCKTSFTFESILRDHQKNIHKIYHCYICDISFDGVDKLRIHAAKYHATSNKKNTK